MPPTTNSLDPQAVALARAIRQQESGGDATRAGKSGEYGAYQFIEPTWQKYSAEAGVNVPLNQATLEQQNQVAYHKIKQWKDEGKNVGQIASMWNAGEGKPDAYIEGNAGTNSSGVNYDTKAYAKAVAEYYQHFKSGTPGADQPTGGVTGYAPPPPPPPPPTDSSTDSPQQGLLGKVIGGAKAVGNFLAPSVADAYHLVKGDNEKTGLQLAGDLGSTALSAATLIPGVGEGVLAAKGLLGGAKAAETAAELGGLAGKGFASDIGAKAAWDTGSTAAKKAAPTLLGSVGKNAALGAGFSTTQALGEGETDPTKLAESAGIGAATGGIVGAAGSTISKAAQVLPQRLVQGVIKNANPDVAKYALTKPLGSPSKMLTESDASLKEIGSKLGAALTHSSVKDVVVPSEQIIPKVMQAFPNAELSPEALQVEISKIAPLQKRLVSKLFSGEGLTIDELHTLNSAIGQNTYKMAFDDPTVKAGKAIGNSFYQAAKDIITKAAPETTELFDQYSKEKALNTALYKVSQRGAKSQAITLKDIISLIGGFSALGPVGAVGALAAERAATSPTVNMKAAGLLGKLSPNAINYAAGATTLGASGLLGKLPNNR